jgi:hypothetical protein
MVEYNPIYLAIKATPCKCGGRGTDRDIPDPEGGEERITIHEQCSECHDTGWIEEHVLLEDVFTDALLECLSTGFNAAKVREALG